LSDLRDCKEKELDCDLCIVGSGPAGLSLAMELAGSGLRVIVLESGDASGESTVPASLNTVENTGVPRQQDQSRVRNRCFGGTSLTWSGRCISLDAIDFETRAWICHTGWPIDLSTLTPYLSRAAPYLGLRSPDLAQQENDANGEDHDSLLNTFDLRPLVWQFSREGDSSLTEDYVRFGARFNRIPVRDRKNIEIWTRATLTHINTDPVGSHVVSLDVADSNGRLVTIRPLRTVLCGGAIENARMMLASNRLNQAGVGNSNGLVGSFLMDHPKAVVGSFHANDIPAVQRKYGLLRHASGFRTQRGWSLTPSLQQSGRLANGAAWATQHLADDDVWRALRGLRRPYGRTRLSLALVVAQNLKQIVTGVWQRLVQRKPLPRRWGRLDLEVMVEQQPDIHSRITLSDRCDAFGVPLSRIHWTISELEGRSAIQLARSVERYMGEVEGIRPTLVDWVRENRPADAIFSDPAHPNGTTRMAKSVEDGVVDLNCKVFDVDNLYIAGSSVFPTAGHANPTLTIVALAIRLADHLKSTTPLH
jgi:choline dehydrogenase-like flavoprotein